MNIMTRDFVLLVLKLLQEIATPASTMTYEAAADAMQHPAGSTESVLHESQIFNPR